MLASKPSSSIDEIDLSHLAQVGSSEPSEFREFAVGRILATDVSGGIHLMRAISIGLLVCTSLVATVAVSCSSYSGPCEISASSYDQSCGVDSDCAEVTSTNYCATDTCLCNGNSAINVAALAQFNADISKTPLVGSHNVCSCAAQLGPCCRSGTCTMMMCFSSADALPACADAGGSCAPAGATCGKSGPPDSCAFSDEQCCL